MALLAALAGGIGAVARYLIDSAIMARLARSVRGSSFPWGTFVVNVTGSLLLGALTGLVAPLYPAGVILGVGLLGGYTTFSAASYETVRLLQRGRTAAAVLSGLGQLLCAVAAALAGFALASLG